MPREARHYLFDIHDACIRVETYTVGLSFHAYLGRSQVRDAVERCLEIIGEAVRQGIQHHPDLASLFPDAASIIGLRNILAHEYGEVDDERVWLVAITKVPDLRLRMAAEMDTRKLVKDASK